MSPQQAIGKGGLLWNGMVKKVAEGKPERREDIEREKKELDRDTLLMLFEANVWDPDRQDGWISFAVCWPEVTAQKLKSSQTPNAF